MFRKWLSMLLIAVLLVAALPVGGALAEGSISVDTFDISYQGTARATVTVADGDPAGQEIKIQLVKDGSVLATKTTTIADGAGTYSCKFNKAIDEGDYEIWASFTHGDAANANSGMVEVRAPAPPPPSRTPIDNVSFIRSGTTVTITGDATTGEAVKAGVLVSGGNIVGDDTAQSGSFSVSVDIGDQLTPGESYTVAAWYQDDSGNKKTAPSKLDIPALPPARADIENVTFSLSGTTLTVTGDATTGEGVKVGVIVPGGTNKTKSGTVKNGRFTISLDIGSDLTPGQSYTVAAWYNEGSSPKVPAAQPLAIPDSGSPDPDPDPDPDPGDGSVKITIATLTGGSRKFSISGAAEKGKNVSINLVPSKAGGVERTFTATASSKNKYALTDEPMDPGEYLARVKYEGSSSPAVVASDYILVTQKINLGIDSVAPSGDQIKVNANGFGGATVKLTLTGKENRAETYTIPTGSTYVAFTYTFKQLKAGDYTKLRIEYTKFPNNYTSGDATETTTGTPWTVGGVKAGDIGNVVVTPGVGKATITGTGQKGEAILVNFYQKGVRVNPKNVPGTIDKTTGKFTVTTTLIPGAYDYAVISYKTYTGASGESRPFTVPSTPEPDPLTLVVDPIFTISWYVVGKTTPNTKVQVDTTINGTKFSEARTSDKNGVFSIPLGTLLPYGTKVTVTAAPGTDKATKKELTVQHQSIFYGTLRLGDYGDAVLALQKRLKELGYSVTLNSSFDSQTEAAVRAFQRINGLMVDGVAGSQTQTRLFSVSALPYDGGGGGTYYTLVRGDRGNAVWDLQVRLRELGYYTIRVDGIFGIGTQTAVREFQWNNGLSGTGVADPETQRILYSSSAKPKTGGGGSYDTLRNGSRGSAVRSLQTRLSALGYYRGYIDGIFGSQTETAVRSFQRLNGLSTTGIADSTTQVRLYSSSAIAYNGGGGGSSGYVYLHYGSQGQAVVRLQTALKNLGYYSGKIDGMYYDQTYSAVKKFQKAYGLAVDGIAGRLTQNKLYGTSY